MKYQLKKISKSGIAAAIAKAELYRYLNEPEEAESICRDILGAEPGHQLALRLLGLAITDQFTGEPSDRHGEAEQIFQKLADRYERLYYTGLLHERRVKAMLKVGRPPATLLPLLEQAMHHFAEAERIRPQDNEESILRWNRCVRLLETCPEFFSEREFTAFEVQDSPPA
jgi:tetratricopeptide (TPR) repeat protein